MALELTVELDLLHCFLELELAQQPEKVQFVEAFELIPNFEVLSVAQVPPVFGSQLVPEPESFRPQS